MVHDRVQLLADLLVQMRDMEVEQALVETIDLLR